MQTRNEIEFRDTIYSDVEKMHSSAAWIVFSPPKNATTGSVWSIYIYTGPVEKYKKKKP